MNDDQKVPEPLVPGDVLKLVCPICEHVRPTRVSDMVRRIEFICDKCGTPTEISSATSKPVAKVRLAKPGFADQVFDFIVLSDGPWCFIDEGERSILNSIEMDSDRAIAIIVGSMIEERIQTALITRMTRDKKIEDRMFQPSGPLGPFANKVHLCRLLGLISSAAYDDLIRFKDIRNAFAHNLAIKDFGSDSIKDQTMNLKLVDAHVVEKTDGFSVGFAPGSIPTICIRHADQRKKMARERYLMTAQLFAIKFMGANRKDWPLPFV